jgi:hypothetical protein
LWEVFTHVYVSAVIARYKIKIMNFFVSMVQTSSIMMSLSPCVCYSAEFLKTQGSFLLNSLMSWNTTLNHTRRLIIRLLRPTKIAMIL